MRIDTLTLKNFRCFEQKIYEFPNNFTVIIGDNATGKTALIEALAIAASAFFLGIDKAEPRHIQKKDIGYQKFEREELKTFEMQFPVVVGAKGTILNEIGNKIPLGWQRTLEGEKRKTTIKQAVKIKEYAKGLQEHLRNGQDVTLPLISYYSTESVR